MVELPMRGECTADIFDSGNGNGNDNGNSDSNGNDNGNDNRETQQSAEVDDNVTMMGT